MSAVPVLQGQRCVLRELRIDDATCLALHADKEAVWRNLFEGFPRAGFVWGVTVAAPAKTA